MIRQRLINCDFLNMGGFADNLSNKAKLLYFYFLTNADDKGFVGNANTIANSLDQCEENFENTLFTYHYRDALSELIERGYAYEFVDKHNNKVYLIRHWFMHNKEQKYLSTNFVSYLAKVELVDGEYQWKNHQEKKLKENEIKVKEIKVNKTYEEIESNKDKENSDWEQDWDKTLKELDTLPKENK